MNAIVADSRYAGRADDLRSLSSAVADEDDDSWTGVDLFAAFPPASTVAVRHQSRAETLWGMAAGISVFLPIAWTWWSLHSATSAYHDLLADGDEGGRTFLALWTGGFDGRLDGVIERLHRLVPMAMVSLSLIVFAVICIVAHRWVAQQAVAKEDGEQAECEARLTEALTAAQRHLNQRRSDTPGHVEALIKRSVRQLRQAHEDTSNAASDLKEAAEELGATVGPLLVAATKATGDLGLAATTLHGAEANLAHVLGKVQSGLDTALANVGSAIGEKTDSLEAGIAQSLLDMSAALGLQTDQLKVATTQAAGDLAGEVAKASGSHKAVSSELQAFTAASTTASLETRSLIVDLKDAVTTLGVSLSSHDSALQAQVSELTAARDAAERLLRQLELGADVNGRSEVSV
ncbi:hypothetical protein [Nocardioides sediminis]|uniref:hypothetical protein n=1 Tax=Nocardioides sediminis TaxID=433648 RepID=UPI00131F326B|nr:hypothetical protein [Nocardioides sediminis]